VSERRVDPIDLQLLRSRLEAAADEGALAIEQTAVSPVVAEGKDFATNILSPSGDLLVGGGRVDYKWAVASNPVRITLERHRGSIQPGDVFASNDPHSGGGNHPQDIEVCCPVFLGDEIVAWVGASAHMIDLGGMTFGSWAPDATECYQEAVRFPPVRLFSGGVEQSDTWDLLLTNVRLPDLLEMDLRGLVAGCHVTADKVLAVVRALGSERFATVGSAMCSITEQVLRDRIRRIADGKYSMSGWVEWGDETLHIPCVLEVRGDTLQYDFRGAPPQVPHFVNSKAYIVRGQIATDLRNQIGQDLPYCEGIFEPVELLYDPRSVVDSEPPAPIGSAHLEVAMTASGIALQCLQMALSATVDPDLPRLFHGPMGTGALATHSWSYVTPAGTIDGFVLSESWQAGSSSGMDRDGSDLVPQLVGTQNIFEFVDIEIIEAWYPIRIHEKRCAPGVYGAGEFRSGAGCQLIYSFAMGGKVVGATLAMREALPICGAAGGLPGLVPGFRKVAVDGSVSLIDAHATGVELVSGEYFELRTGSGGGWGDPLERLPASVAADVATGRLSTEDALATYAVGLDDVGDVDVASTLRARDAVRRDRLDRALPPLTPIAQPTSIEIGPDAAPLYFGVIQSSGWAIAAESGAILANSPSHWTDGCPRLETVQTSEKGAEWLQVSYLDPLTGRFLHTEARPIGYDRSFTSLPDRWTSESWRS
jgi:N-methylhydantoinase B